jgi:hypothetical protein
MGACATDIPPLPRGILTCLYHAAFASGFHIAFTGYLIDGERP